MGRIALMMLFGARGRYAAVIFGLSFAVLLITQQLAIFMGVLERGTGPLQNIGSPDIWVCTRETKYVEMLRPMREQELWRIRSIAGVEWAQPMTSFPVIVQLPDGAFQDTQLFGIDRVTLTGRPPEIIEGNLADLRLPDAVFIGISGRKNLHDAGVGDTLRLNDRRARVVGICRAKEGILSRPQLFCTMENLKHFMPLPRNHMGLALVKARTPADIPAVRREIRAMPNLTAFTADEFRWECKWFIITRTAIGLNFAVTVALGLVVGLVVSTAAFNQFTSENLPHFALLKALGTRPRKLVGMVLLQAAVAGLISYGIGVGLAGLMVLPGLRPDVQLTSAFPWQLMLGALLPMLVCISTGSLVSLRRVIKVDPVIVFQ